MKIVPRVLAAIVLLAWVLPSSAAQAQQVPRGSYLRSCPEATVSRNTLIATCRQVDGQWRQSTLADVDRCVGDIGNNNGRLRCSYGPPPGPVPGGSYQLSCTDARISGSTLSAACRTRNGRTQRSALAEINRCVGDIGNDDGRLTCSRR